MRTGMTVRRLLFPVLASLVSSAFAGETVDSTGAEALWHRHLDAPAAYASFVRKVVPGPVFDCGDFTVECLAQANGPGTMQRVMRAVPKNRNGKCPAVVAPFYFPEAMLGFDPSTGGVASTLAPSRTNLTYYAAVTYLADLARRGYVAISADACHLTYDPKDAPADAWKKWKHVGEALKRDWPEWSGIGKLAFDTRLLIDLLADDPRVDAGRIGIIGHSLGGKMAFYAGCLDPRIKVIVASDFGIGWTQTNWNDVWYWGDRLEDLRAKGLSNADLLSQSGGKPFCLIAGKYDDADSGAVMRAAKGYDACPERLLLIRHGTGHRPPRWATEEGYRFLDRYLKRL